MESPKKPQHAAPCNGCGKCCQAELCHVAEMALGRSAQAPCPLLEFHDGRYWCALVRTEAKVGMEPLIAQALGIGIGCYMDGYP